MNISTESLKKTFSAISNVQTNSRLKLDIQKLINIFPSHDSVVILLLLVHFCGLFIKWLSYF